MDLFCEKMKPVAVDAAVIAMAYYMTFGVKPEEEEAYGRLGRFLGAEAGEAYPAAAARVAAFLGGTLSEYAGFAAEVLENFALVAKD